MPRQTSGPMAVLMRNAGFSPDQIRAAGDSFSRNFLGEGVIGSGIMRDEDMRIFVRSFRQVAADMEATERSEDRFTVAVHFTDRTIENGEFVTEEMIVELLADNEMDAMLIASQWVSSRHGWDDGMVVSARILEVDV